MLNIDDALKVVLGNLPERRRERVHFQAAQGRVLAEDVRATMNVPSFRKSAMDGYAVRAMDVVKVPAELSIVGKIRAGGGETVRVGSGEAAGIMTGAPVPEGADAVQMVEKTDCHGSKVRILRPVKANENIVPLGNEASEGDLVLESGRSIGPAEIAVLATFGHHEVQVYSRPTIALLSTGDELVEVEKEPKPDQIRNSNAYSLYAQLRHIGLEPEYLGIAQDNLEELRRIIAKGLEKDVLILTGGVSMGEYDFVKDVFQELSLEILFTKVAMKPGKPTVFARKGDTLVFGLPGNPVSTFISFENFVRPALGRMCGFELPDLLRIKGALLSDMKQRPGRTAFLPAWVMWDVGGWKIEPLAWKGSSDIIGFSRANATVIFPSDRDQMRRGESVEAMLLPDFSLRRRS